MVLKLRLLSQLSFVLKPYSQRVTYLSPRLSNNILLRLQLGHCPGGLLQTL